MPRQTRIEAPGALHHIICRGIERRDIFQDDADRENFVDQLGHVLTRKPQRNKNYFVVDACFLADKCPCRIRLRILVNAGDQRPDIYRAENFETRAKKYYQDHWFGNPGELNNAPRRLMRNVSTPSLSTKGWKGSLFHL